MFVKDLEQLVLKSVPTETGFVQAVTEAVPTIVVQLMLAGWVALPASPLMLVLKTV